MTVFDRLRSMMLRMDFAATLLAAAALPLAGAHAQSHAIRPVPACVPHGYSASNGPAPTEVPPGRRAVLARGVNVTDLLAADRYPDLEATFRRLRLAGIRHIRIPVPPDAFSDVPPPWQADVLRRLDHSVCAAIAGGLAVVIDLHPFRPLGPEGEPLQTLTTQLAEVWRRLAGRYSALPADKIFFEVLNEPKLPDIHQWEAMQTQLVAAIRSVAPDNTVIATASPWSTAAALTAMTPLSDRNVVYTFHFYTPMIFTHQGATWSLPNFGSIGGLVFPANSGNVAAVSRRAAHGLLADLDTYGKDFRNADPIAAEIQPAADWAKRNGTILMVTEFGVYDKAAPRPARAAWLADVRRELESNDIGWTIWEYRGGFGIDSDLRAGCSTSASAATALHLCAP